MVPWAVVITMGWCMVVLGLWTMADPIYVLDLTNKTQMKGFLKRTTLYEPKTFKNQPERAYYDLQCSIRLEKLKAKYPHEYRNATSILLGKHESLPNVYACLLTVVTDKEAKGLCESDFKDYVRNDSAETHKVICRYRRSDHESNTDNEDGTH